MKEQLSTPDLENPPATMTQCRILEEKSISVISVMPHNDFQTTQPYLITHISIIDIIIIVIIIYVN